MCVWGRGSSTKVCDIKFVKVHTYVGTNEWERDQTSKEVTKAKKKLWFDTATYLLNFFKGILYLQYESNHLYLYNNNIKKYS